MTANKITNEYTFEDEYFNVTSYKNEDPVGTQKIYYKDIHNVKENQEYIFIYINKVNAYIIKKSNASDEDLKAVQDILALYKKA